MPSATKNIKVFISYKKKHDGSANFAWSVDDELDNHFDSFIDRKIERGDDWADTIYERVRNSDVLIVLLEKETHESEWVQREVDVARGANIFILPLQIDEDVDTAKVIERLALDRTQHFREFSGTPEQYRELIADIKRLAKKTRNAQKSWMTETEKRWRIKQAANNKSHASYSTSEYPDCIVHLATGDISEMQGVDVIVNSENNYMQMARVYEGTTVSAVLRYKGSLIKGGRVLEDSVQDLLDEQVFKSSLYTGRPVTTTEIIPTAAGHPESELARKGVRYIFHACTVVVDPNDPKSIMPITTDAGIRKSVEKSLSLFLEVNRNQGVISPPKGMRRKREENSAPNYQPITSIIFTLFGTGHGGRPVSDVAPAMVKAIHDFLRTNSNNAELANLKDIYLSVFSETDIEDVEEALSEKFTRQ